jgi:hypothetical protein
MVGGPGSRRRGRFVGRRNGRREHRDNRADSAREYGTGVDGGNERYRLGGLVGGTRSRRRRYAHRRRDDGRGNRDYRDHGEQRTDRGRPHRGR